MNNDTDICDITDVETLKQIVHEETTVVKAIKAAQNNEEEATPELPLELSLKRSLDELPEKEEKTMSLTMFRIPADVRERNKVFYEPQLVSIGPFYRGRAHLRAMEEQKLYLLRDFLARYHEIDIKVLVKEMQLLENKARGCYAERINLDSREFVEMLLLDSCFILQVAIKWCRNEPDRLKHVRWATVKVLADLLLVENQIPFFVVMKLVNLIQADEKKRAKLLNYVVEYIECFGASKFVGIVPSQVEPHSLRQARNLLHVYYQLFLPKRMSYRSNPKHAPASSDRRGLLTSLKLCVFPEPNQANMKQISEEPVYVIPCVTELLLSGIIFKPKKSPADLFDVTFQDGVIEMPPLSLDPTGKRAFLNIVAFEQSNGDNKCLPFSSYVALMEDLVKTSKDVVALRQCGIIYTLDPNEEEAALFFSHAGDVCVIDHCSHYFKSLFGEIKTYYDSRQNKNKNKNRR